MSESLVLPPEVGLIPTAPSDFRSGFVGLIGRPNVGKSTLMNQLIGQKIAITSPIAQTTRNRLRGILTTPNAQIIFVDTPGIHKPHHRLGNILVQTARSAIDTVDGILFVVDSASPLGKGDRYIANLLTPASTPVILGLNKVDQQPHDPQLQAKLDTSYQDLAQACHWPLIKFSALQTTGLDALLTLLVNQLSPGPYYYPPDLITDQPERFIMGELIREQILHLTREEVPHSVAVTVEKVDEAPQITRVYATIHVERSSQKGIVIGKQGSMLKAIGSAARHQIQKMIAGQAYLELFVKVQPKWRQSRLRLQSLGYKLEGN